MRRSAATLSGGVAFVVGHDGRREGLLGRRWIRRGMRGREPGGAWMEGGWSWWAHRVAGPAGRALGCSAGQWRRLEAIASAGVRSGERAATAEQARGQPRDSLRRSSSRPAPGPDPLHTLSHPLRVDRVCHATRGGGRGTAIRRARGPQPGASLVGERRTIDRDFRSSPGSTPRLGAGHGGPAPRRLFRHCGAWTIPKILVER